MADSTSSVDPEVVTVMDIVDTLEELVGGGRRLPFTPSVVVNEEDILELVDRIRVALPDDLLTARHTVEEREQLLGRAQREAEAVTGRAQEEAQRRLREADAEAAALVESNAITRAAEERARALTDEAEAAAATQRSAADDYAREVMERLHEQLERSLATVRAGLESLPSAAAPRRRQKR